MSIKMNVQQVSHGHAHDMNDDGQLESIMTEYSSSTESADSQTAKMKMKQYNRIVDCRIPKTSLIFVNDKHHLRHHEPNLKVSTINEQNLKHAENWDFSVDSMYGEPKQRLMDPLNNFYLNFVYDLKFTDFLRDVIIQSRYFQSQKADKKIQEIENFMEACDSVINTYNHLHTHLFPKPLSDFQFGQEMNKVHKIIKAERMRHQPAGIRDKISKNLTKLQMKRQLFKKRAKSEGTIELMKNHKTNSSKIKNIDAFQSNEEYSNEKPKENLFQSIVKSKEEYLNEKPKKNMFQSDVKRKSSPQPYKNFYNKSSTISPLKSIKTLPKTGVVINIAEAQKQSKSQENESTSSCDDSNSHDSKNSGAKFNHKDNLSMDEKYPTKVSNKFLKKLGQDLEKVIEFQKKSYQIQFKLMFMNTAFSPQEYHQYFKEFHARFIKNYRIGKKDLVTLIEFMAQPDMIGSHELNEKVFPIIDDEWRPEQLNQKHHHKPKEEEKEEDETKNKQTNYFSKERHELLFYKLSHGKGFINYLDLVPYLMVFFEVYLLSALEIRIKSFQDLLDPTSQKSLINIFKDSGVTDLYNAQITYKMVENTMMILKSYYPQNLKFEGIQNVLNLCKVQMDVETISAREKHKQSFFTLHPYKFQRQLQFEFEKAFKRRLGQLHLHQLLLKQKNSSCKPTKSIKPTEKMMVYFVDYDQTNQNLGFGHWLAYQISLQMVAYQIQNQQKGNNQLMHLIEDPQLAFSQNKSYFFEEKIWNLAMNLEASKNSFNLTNFNSIVKQSLLKRMQSRDPDCVKKCDAVLPDDDPRKPIGQIPLKDQKVKQIYIHGVSNSYSVAWKKIDTNTVNKGHCSHDIQDMLKSEVIFQMHDYVDCLFKVYKKNICPWVTYKQVEVAVYNFIKNLVHKASVILADQLELKIIRATNYGLGPAKKFNKKGLTQKAALKRMTTSRFYAENKIDSKHPKDQDAQKQKIQFDLNRIKTRIDRIFDKKHEIHKIFKKAYLKNTEDKVAQHDFIHALNQYDSAFNNKDLMRETKYRTPPPEFFQGQKLDHECKSDNLARLSLKSKNTLNRGLELGLVSLIQSKTIHKSKLKKRESLNDLKMHINCLVDHLFVSDKHKHNHDEKGHESGHANEHEDGKYKRFGRNLINFDNNKYFYKLLQIFGFRDESKLSLIDKDKMKIKLLEALTNKTFGTEDILEQFLVAHCIQELHRYDSMHLDNFESFRKILLKTDCCIDWNYKIEQQIKLNIQNVQKNGKQDTHRHSNSDKSQYDIFSMSFDILRNLSMGTRHEHGVNMGLNQRYNLLKTKEKNLKLNWYPIGEQEQRNLIRYLNDSIEEISLKESLYKKSLLDEIDFTKPGADQKMQKEKDQQEQIIKFELDKKNGLCSGHNHGHHHHHEEDKSHSHSHHSHGIQYAVTKMEREIEKCHSLNTVLTSQKYIGLFDLHDQNQQREHEQHEEEHKQERLQKQREAEFVELIPLAKMSGRVKELIQQEEVKKGHNHGKSFDDEFSEMNVSKCSKLLPTMEKSVSFQKSARESQSQQFDESKQSTKFRKSKSKIFNQSFMEKTKELKSIDQKQKNLSSTQSKFDDQKYTVQEINALKHRKVQNILNSKTKESRKCISKIVANSSRLRHMIEEPGRSEQMSNFQGVQGSEQYSFNPRYEWQFNQRQQARGGLKKVNRWLEEDQESFVVSTGIKDFSDSDCLTQNDHHGHLKIEEDIEKTQCADQSQDAQNKNEDEMRNKLREQRASLRSSIKKDDELQAPNFEAALNQSKMDMRTNCITGRGCGIDQEDCNIF